MKNILLMIACYLFALGPIAHAEIDFNIEAYSRTELAEIYAMVSQELFGSSMLPSGAYIVGRDIPAGRYTILSTAELQYEGYMKAALTGEEVNDELLSEYAVVAVFNSASEYMRNSDSWKWLNEDFNAAVHVCNTLLSGVTIELKDGMVLAVGYGRAAIRPFDGSIFIEWHY